MSKLVLIDGHSILNRAFYGVPDLTNAAGLHTNAIYGFLNILFKILDEESPDYLTVAFDVKAPTFRHEMFKEYKGTRKPMPEELREQVPVMKEVLQAMGIRIIEQAGYEADDLLGTIAKRAEAEGIDVSLVSGDRDLLQIATDRIKIRIPKTKGGRTEIENYYAADVEAKYQVNPVQFIDLKALMGDTADNIPGVPKVGEKTATDLMVQFGSLDGIYEHIDEVTKKSVKESLIQNKDLAYLSRELATIKLDSPLTYTLEEARVGNFFNEASYILFKKLEFKNLLNKFEKGVSNEEISASFHLVENLAEVEALFTRVLSDKDRQIGLKVVKEAGRHGELLGVALHLQEEGSFLVLKQGFLTEDYLKENYFNFLNHIRKLRKGVPISCTIRLHQIKFKDKTGIPPVDKGTLMYYASSEPTNFENKNTILNNKDAASYIEKIGSYPLHLDIALPLYSWGIVRNPFGQIKLINGVRKVTIDARPDYYRQTKEGIYCILQSHYINGVWVNKDYELKVEEVSSETLLEAAKLLRKKLRRENREIIFYHLDKEIIKQYSTEQLTNIINTFS